MFPPYDRGRKSSKPNGRCKRRGSKESCRTPIRDRPPALQPQTREAGVCVFACSLQTCLGPWPTRNARAAHHPSDLSLSRAGNHLGANTGRAPRTCLPVPAAMAGRTGADPAPRRVGQVGLPSPSGRCERRRTAPFSERLSAVLQLKKAKKHTLVRNPTSASFSRIYDHRLARQGICNDGHVSKRSPAFGAVWLFGSATQTCSVAFSRHWRTNGVFFPGRCSLHAGLLAAWYDSGCDSNSTLYTIRLMVSANGKTARRLGPLPEPLVFLSFCAGGLEEPQSSVQLGVSWATWAS